MKRIISILLIALMIIAAMPLAWADDAPVVDLSDDGDANPTWSFDYTEKDGAIHHKGDEITTKADLIKNNALSFLYSGEGLNVLFESMYADLGSKMTSAIWTDADPLDVSVAYFYGQGAPSLFRTVLPMEPMMFKPGYNNLGWSKFFDGIRLPYTYTKVLLALSKAKTFEEKAALWSAALLGKHKTDVSFWSVSDTVTVNGTKALVPKQNSRSSWPSDGTMVDAFQVDAVADVVDWSAMTENPQATWNLDANQPETLYSALAACFCGYASVISASLSGNTVQGESVASIGSTPMEPIVSSAATAGLFYTQFLAPLYEALEIEEYPSLEQLVADAAVGQIAGTSYAFIVNGGLTLFREIMAPIVDWVENVLFADPINVLLRVAPALYTLLGFTEEESIFDQPAANVRLSVGGLTASGLNIYYKDIFAKMLTALHLESDLNPYVECSVAHKWNDGEVTTEATCKQEGVLTFTCTSCGSTKTEAIAKLPHQPATVPGTPATCVDPGLTDGTVCGVCGETITPQQTIPATGVHVDNNGDGRCDTCGKQLENICKWCGKVHGSGFLEKLIAFIHKTLASIFGARY